MFKFRAHNMLFYILIILSVLTQRTNQNKDYTDDEQWEENERKEQEEEVPVRKHKSYRKEKDWKDKKLSEYSDNDFEMLYEEWEENDEEKLPPDELPYGHPDRPKANKPFKLSDIDLNNPDSIKRATKADKTVITLATVTGDPTKEETEALSRLWQMGLYNNHIDISGFIVDDDRIMFSALDGATAFEVKDYLIEQERVDFVEIDQEIFPGKFTNRKYEL